MRLLRREKSPPRAQERPANDVTTPPGQDPAAGQDPPVRETASGEAIPPVRNLDGGPDSPLEIGKTGWRNTLQRAVKKYSRDRCSMAVAASPTTGSWPCFPPSSRCWGS